VPAELPAATRVMKPVKQRRGRGGHSGRRCFLQS
jgi:hypothetical protein